jgi:aerobic carbon-monoxide dehydrogenase medium subunit
VRPFDLLEPQTLEDAARILADDPDLKAIAGGTALVILMKQGVFLPQRLVNLKKVRDASYVEFDPARGLRLGALTSIFDVESHPLVRRHYPALADATHKVANIRIRNLATIGGNLAHADYQSDPPTVFAALDAHVVTTGSDGERRLPLSEFLAGAYETALRPGELVREIQLPPPEPGLDGVYLKFVTRTAGDRPCAGVAAFARCEDGVIEKVRVVVGAVNPVPVRIVAVEERLRGQRVADVDLHAVSQLASESIDPIGDLRGGEWYKRQIVPVLVRRALEQVLGETKDGRGMS